jgi:flagellar basal body P-ring protein FlgI
MQTHNVRRPEEALKSLDTAMVLVRGFIPPGARKGDTFDVEVYLPPSPRTDTTSLRGGWLMQSRLRETAILDNDVHTGHVAGLAQGPIVVDALFDKSGDEVLQVRGRVLTGGIVQLDREMGLAIRGEHTSVKTSTTIGHAINERFHDFDHGSKKGLANPTRDNFLELKVHSRYRNDVGRYIQVVRSIALNESPVERIARIAELEKELLEPTASRRASLQLEAIGKEAIPTLRKGLVASDPEVRFHAAEALAYLDDADAVPALLDAARTERAFRWRAMSALAVLDQYSAQDALLELMNVPSAETRYGAFRALRARPREPLTRGEVLGDEFALHVMSTTGEPMIHISRSSRPEIVLFGQGQRLESPNFLFAGTQILVNRQNERSVKVSRFSAGDDDQHEVCSTNVEDVLRAIVKLGGGYAEAIEALEEAKAKGFLAARLEIDALPRPNRVYRREATRPASEEDSESTTPDAIPGMFLDRLKRDAGVSESSPANHDLDETPPLERGWLDRMTLWMVQ